MGKYLEQCEKCGDETITYGWYPERCPFCELAAKTTEFDRLNESLDKNKRLFTNALADKIIESQLKRIKQLEDHLSLALQSMDNLRQSMRGGAP